MAKEIPSHGKTAHLERMRRFMDDWYEAAFLQVIASCDFSLTLEDDRWVNKSLCGTGTGAARLRFSASQDISAHGIPRRFLLS